MIHIYSHQDSADKERKEKIVEQKKIKTNSGLTSGEREEKGENNKRLVEKPNDRNGNILYNHT
jgi:hypothetical protein